MNDIQNDAMKHELHTGEAMSCPVEVLFAVKDALLETLGKCLGHHPCGDDLLSALVRRPAYWLVPLMTELSWTGMDTSHCVVDAEGLLTGKRVWLEDGFEEDGLSPDPDYAEVQIGICNDGRVVMTLDGTSPTGAWQGFYFAIHKRDLASLLDDESERQTCIRLLNEMSASRAGVATQGP